MKFYGRESELASLMRMRERSLSKATMTVVTGRRRIGKTRLILESLASERYLYFFAAKKNEALLCQDFLREIENKLDKKPIGAFNQFQHIFQWLLEYAKTEHLNLIIDEFQDLSKVNTSIFSEMQRDWDLNKEGAKLNLILSGSAQSMMYQIFQDAKEPLFGRADRILKLAPFRLSTLRIICRDHEGEKLRQEDFLCLYTITGGVPKYVELLIDEDCLTYDCIMNSVFEREFLFLEEGKHALIQDLGKDYGIYFSILGLIASGFTARPKIESVLQQPIGGYLTRLEHVYGLIARRRSVFSKPNTNDIRYFLEDNFFRFWFRFIFKHQAMVEADNLPALRKMVDEQYRVYAGMILENLIRQQLRETQSFTLIGSYWERGNQNEIDVVAVNEPDLTAIVGEVKWQKKNVSLPRLELKAEKILKGKLSGFDVKYKSFGLEDVDI